MLLLFDKSEDYTKMYFKNTQNFGEKLLLNPSDLSEENSVVVHLDTYIQQ